MARIAVNGACGRMGRMLVKEVSQTAGMELCAAFEAADSPFLGQDAGMVAGVGPLGVPVTAGGGALPAGVDAIIDFTIPAVTMPLAEQAAAKGIRLVIGSTGLSPAEKARLRELAAKAGIVCSSNMSVGVNLLFHLSEQAARLLGEDYDIEIVEMHHNQKKDAPSGTAERLGEILAGVRGLDYQTDARHGRVGLVGARTRREIGIHSLRGGDVVGDHTVIFATNGERVELTHKASSRETFAKGAVRAVRFLLDNPPGFYDMQDVLGLR